MVFEEDKGSMAGGFGKHSERGKHSQASQSLGGGGGSWAREPSLMQSVSARESRDRPLSACASEPTTMWQNNGGIGDDI